MNFFLVSSSNVLLHVHMDQCCFVQEVKWGGGTVTVWTFLEQAAVVPAVRINTGLLLEGNSVRNGNIGSSGCLGHTRDIRKQLVSS